MRIFKFVPDKRTFLYLFYGPVNIYTWPPKNTQKRYWEAAPKNMLRLKTPAEDFRLRQLDHRPASDSGRMELLPCDSGASVSYTADRLKYPERFAPLKLNSGKKVFRRSFGMALLSIGAPGISQGLKWPRRAQ